MNSFVLLTLFAAILVSSQTWAQEYNEYDGDYEARDSRQASAYAYEPPSKTCARAAFGNTHCGDFSGGNNGGCDTYCSQKGYPLSWCRKTYCLCHRGRDLGAECERV
ncbi:hypothetical protein Ocin01_16878 [Orchesella cincta]|uniref:Uncharacterized protein n=1 Tax=Orchesella cincta TaxID=48709 RepID=A0A1D2MA90_ORCCI|nr:hypothetical protein Ocin01_16878 [Orchesella cincta]